MAIFPQLGPEYYNEFDRGILSRMESFYNEAITLNQSFWGEADIDTRYEAGDQSILNDDYYGNLPAQQRKRFNFNRIRRVINMITGHQRRNRKSTIVVPVENTDQLTADQFSKIMMWINQQEGVLETISNSFHGACVTGMNLLQVWIDYRSDPISGNIRVDNCHYNSFLIDPYFKKPDLSDCNAIWKRSFLTAREAASLLPQFADEIASMPGSGNRDGKFQFMPESYEYNYNNRLTYDEYYYRDYRQQRMLIDTQTGESIEWRSNDEDALREFLRVYPQITVVEQEIPTVKLAIVVQGKVFYDDVQPSGIDQYPFVPMLAYYEPQMPYFPWRIQGVVRGLRDAQFLYNRRRIIELDILESQINSGLKFKENSLVNPEDAFNSGQGKPLILKEEAQMTDVEYLQAPQIPPSMIQLSELLAREVQEIAGVNEELLGTAVDDKAGILAMLRQGAGLTTLQRLFDQLDYSQKLLGKLIISLVQNNFTPGKVKRILQEDPSKQFYDKTFGRFDAAIEEGLNTTTQKQMQFAQLLHLRQAGVPIPDDVLLESSTIQNKQELTKSILQRSEQQRQMAIQQQQLQMAEMQSQAEKNSAKALADRGLGIERLSRIEENKALATERKAEAQKDRELGLLHLVKALKEIQTIDLQQLEKLFALGNLIDATNSAHSDQDTIPDRVPDSGGPLQSGSVVG